MEALSYLTHRQNEVYSLAAVGHAQKEIAARMGISYKTVGTHLDHIYREIGIHGRVFLTLHAVKNGIIKPQDIPDYTI